MMTIFILSIKYILAIQIRTDGYENTNIFSKNLEKVIVEDALNTKFNRLSFLGEIILFLEQYMTKI